MLKSITWKKKGKSAYFCQWFPLWTSKPQYCDEQDGHKTETAQISQANAFCSIKLRHANKVGFRLGIIDDSVGNRQEVTIIALAIKLEDLNVRKHGVCSLNIDKNKVCCILYYVFILPTVHPIRTLITCNLTSEQSNKHPSLMHFSFSCPCCWPNKAVNVFTHKI